MLFEGIALVGGGLHQAHRADHESVGIVRGGVHRAFVVVVDFDLTGVVFRIEIAALEAIHFIAQRGNLPEQVGLDDIPRPKLFEREMWRQQVAMLAANESLNKHCQHPVEVEIRRSDPWRRCPPTLCAPL